MEERVIIPRRREPRDQDQAADADDAAGAAPAGSCSSGEESTDGDSEPDFEFEFPSLLGRDHGSPAPADDLFADGRIRPAAFYPVFGRRPSARAGSAGDVGVGGLAPAPAPERRTRGQLGRLFLEESRAWNSSSSSSSTGSTASTSSSSSAATAEDGLDGDGGLDGAAPESYCVWAPGGGKPSEPPRPPLRAGKSGSTGSSVARWRRISDLVVGRSQSDGKEKFLFLPVNPHPPTPAPPKQQQEPKPKPRPKPANQAAGGGKKKGSEIGTVAAAHRMAYGGAANGATPRRTFLPYREELVGFFANVNGISRSHAHPY